MERFVSGLGIELDVEAFVQCCRGNMDLSEDDVCVSSADAQQMGVEDEEEEDGAEYFEYTEAPEFYVVDAECYYGEVNMESVAEENPWADMGDGATSVAEEKTWEACMGGCGVWLKGGGWGVCSGCYKKGHGTNRGMWGRVRSLSWLWCPREGVRWCVQALLDQRAYAVCGAAAASASASASVSAVASAFVSAFSCTFARCG